MIGTHFSYKESQDLLLARPCPLSILPLDNVTIANYLLIYKMIYFKSTPKFIG